MLIEAENPLISVEKLTILCITRPIIFEIFFFFKLVELNPVIKCEAALVLCILLASQWVLNVLVKEILFRLHVYASSVRINIRCIWHDEAAPVEPEGHVQDFQNEVKNATNHVESVSVGQSDYRRGGSHTIAT